MLDRSFGGVTSALLASRRSSTIAYIRGRTTSSALAGYAKSIAEKVRENRSTVEQKKFYVRPEHLVGTEETLLRALTMAFAAAIEQGQRTGERPTYQDMADRHYAGPGSGLASAIERFNGCTNVEQRNTNGAALQLDEIAKEYDRRIEHLTNLVQTGRDSGRDGGRQRQPRPDHALHVPPTPTAPPPLPPPMPPPYQPPFMPNLQMPPPYHPQPPWAPPAGPLAAPIPAPCTFQQPGLGLRHDGQRAEPPPLYQRPPGTSALRPDDLRVRNNPTSMSNPFALDFGTRLRATISGGDKDPISKTNYATICAAVKYLAHKGACTKWVAFGLCSLL